MDMFTPISELDGLKDSGFSYCVGSLPRGYFCTIWKDNPPSFKRTIYEVRGQKWLNEAIRLCMEKYRIGEER